MIFSHLPDFGIDRSVSRVGSASSESAKIRDIRVSVDFASASAASEAVSGPVSDCADSTRAKSFSRRAVDSLSAAAIVMASDETPGATTNWAVVRAPMTSRSRAGPGIYESKRSAARAGSVVRFVFVRSTPKALRPPVGSSGDAEGAGPTSIDCPVAAAVKAIARPLISIVLVPGGNVVVVVVLCGSMPGGVLEELDVDINACVVGGNVGTTGGGRVSVARLPRVLELVVVLELLDESGPSGEVVLVVELVPEIVVVAPGEVVVVPPIVVVVELLVVVVELLVDDVVIDGRTVVVVPRIVVDVDDDVLELLLVDASRTVVELVPLGQPPLGAGIMSSSWSP